MDSKRNEVESWQLFIGVWTVNSITVQNVMEETIRALPVMLARSVTTARATMTATIRKRQKRNPMKRNEFPIRIVGEHAPEDEMVTGYTLPHYGIHKAYKRSGWACTHIASGDAVGDGLTRAQAVELAERMEADYPWDERERVVAKRTEIRLLVNLVKAGKLQPAQDHDPACARAMGCLCVGHANGLDVDAECDTNEDNYANRD